MTCTLHIIVILSCPSRHAAKQTSPGFNKDPSSSFSLSRTRKLSARETAPNNASRPSAHHKSSRDGLQAAATSFAETCVAHSVRGTDVSTHPAAFTPAKLPRYLLGDSRQMIKVVAFINFIYFFFLRAIELSLLLLRERPDFMRKLRHGTFYLSSHALFCERK